jgi:hypothetical protein
VRAVHPDGSEVDLDGARVAEVAGEDRQPLTVDPPASSLLRPLRFACQQLPGCSTYDENQPRYWNETYSGTELTLQNVKLALTACAAAGTSVDPAILAAVRPSSALM